MLDLADWLRCCGVTQVVMESTSDYWKSAYYLLEAEGFECWLVNARDVKNVPGRAKTDKADAEWLAEVAGRGMCSPRRGSPDRPAGFQCPLALQLGGAEVVFGGLDNDAKGRNPRLLA
jgi:hypothetical protein